MLMIAVCDDEPAMLKDIGALVGRYMKGRGVGYEAVFFTNGEQLLESGQSFDIVLLDICLGGMDGIETARKLRKDQKDCCLIFITALREYVFDAFDVEAAQYLIKPVSSEKLWAVLDKALERMQKNENDTILIYRRQGYIKLRLSEIYYCESLNHQVAIYTCGNVQHCYGKIEEIARQLNEDFYRCHRSYICNMWHVQGYQKGFAYFPNGESIPVAKRRQPEFTEALLRFQRREMR